jgi:hypothetical protein
MTRFTREFIQRELDARTSSALTSLESSFDFIVDVEFRNGRTYPWVWKVTKRDDWRLWSYGSERTRDDTRRTVEAALDGILSDMGETRRSVVMKSKLRGGE